MTTVKEGNLRLTFPEDWLVTQYDRWAFFAKFKGACQGNKAVDILALDASEPGLWLIELKDYRQHKREKDVSVWHEMALKVRDTLAGLATASFNADAEERLLAQKCLGATKLSVVRHLERPAQLVTLVDEILKLLVEDPNSTVSISVEVSADFPMGASQQLKRAVNENISQLKLLKFRNSQWE